MKKIIIFLLQITLHDSFMLNFKRFAHVIKQINSTK